MNVLRQAIFPVIGLLLAGCAGVPAIVPQSSLKDANTLDAGRMIKGSARIEWPETAWWTTYHDPQLDGLVTQAIAGSPTVRAAKARVALAQAFADARASATAPQVNADASATRERFTALQFIPPPWGGHTDWNNSATFSLSYDLDLWGRLKSQWRSSVDAVHASAAEAQQVRLELENAVVRSYIGLALAFSLRENAQRRLEQLDLRIAIERRRLAAGLGTQMAVTEAEARLPVAQARVDAIDARMLVLKHQLAALSGMGPGAGESLVRPKMSLDAPVGLPDSLPANLVGRRPDIIACRWRIEGAQSDIQAARAAFYPNINLVAFAGFQALGFEQLASNAALIAGAGPAFSLPIFDGGRLRAGLSASTASYDVAVESYNETLLHALEQVSDGLAELQSDSAQARQIDLALAKARKAHEFALAAQRAGLSDYLRALDTYDSVLQQEQALAQVHAEASEAYADLMLALGGGAAEIPAR
ncbi:MAG: efflux transporter outer membrane subunit [Betaproteobacteria bacterium]|nr:efflux transporter outer membrane subunit [Betaproteobacteria bacterium]